MAMTIGEVQACQYWMEITHETCMTIEVYCRRKISNKIPESII